MFFGLQSPELSWMASHVPSISFLWSLQIPEKKASLNFPTHVNMCQQRTENVSNSYRGAKDVEIM